MKVKHLFWLLSVFSFCVLVYNYRSTIVKFLDREKRSPIESDNDIETESNDNDPTEFSFPNRTAEAENQDVVIFHRVPKTGSELMQELGKVRVKCETDNWFTCIPRRNLGWTLGVS